MPPKQMNPDLPVHSFASVKDFENFLERDHATAPGIHLKLAKKSSGIPSVTAAEAIETALCFGWIDGRANALDQNWWLVRYTPRRKKSIWSQKNTNTVARLLEQGRMRPAGTAAVAAAKADGRWDRAYAGPSNITVPADFADALMNNNLAASFFESMNKSDRYAVLWRIETASPKARSQRIEVLVQQLAVGVKPGSKTHHPPLSTANALAAARGTKDDRDRTLGRKRKPVTRTATQVVRRTGLRSQSK